MGQIFQGTWDNSDNDGGHTRGYPLYLLLLIQQFYYSSHFTVEETEADPGFKSVTQPGRHSKQAAVEP